MHFAVILDEPILHLMFFCWITSEITSKSMEKRKGGWGGEREEWKAGPGPHVAWVCVGCQGEWGGRVPGWVVTSPKG